MLQTSNPVVAWALILISGLLEVAFAASIHYSNGFTKPVPTVSVFVFGALSVYLMSLALKVIPIGTAYAVWGGIGAVGTAIVGMVALGETASASRLVCIGLVVAGIVGLQLQETLQ